MLRMLRRAAAAALLFAAAPWGAPAQEAAPAASVSTLDLAACRRLALEKQPVVAAAAASLSAAQARSAALDELRGLPLLTRDLPTRRLQASLGVAVAQTQVDLARQETLYNVTRTYWTVVYAKQQQRTADHLIARLRERKKLLDESEDWTAHVADALLGAAQARRETAVSGEVRALAALREAIGVDDGHPCFDIADAVLPRSGPVPACDDIVRTALERRGEIAIASLFSEITCQEIAAQASKLLSPTVRTFAAASDIHARLIPPGSSSADYRPAALPPEMPSLLVGNRAGRVEQARAYNARAEAVVEKTRGLIALEARDAFQRLQEGLRKLASLETAAVAAAKAEVEGTKGAKAPRESGVTRMEAIHAGLLDATIRVEVNETLFQIVLDLTLLERVTAGGYCLQ